MLVALYAVPLLLIIVAWYTLGAAATAKPFSSGLVGWLGKVAANIPIAGPLTAKLAVAMASWITNKIGDKWHEIERGAVAWLSGLYGWIALPIVQALMWPYHLFRLQSWLITVEIPRLYRAISRPVTNVTKTITKRLQPIERTIIKLPKLTKAQATALIGAAVATYIHPYLADLRWLKRHFAALQHAIDVALPVPHFPSLSGILRRLRRLERRTVVAATVAVVVAALARLGLGWIRCGKVKKAGRSLCGIDTNLLDELLLGTAAIFSVVSVVEFAEGLRSIEDEAITVMGKLVREWPA